MKIQMTILMFFVFPIFGSELTLPSRCDLYADSGDFSCCIVTYQERPNIYFEFYARRLSMFDDPSEVEDFLGVYFAFDNWPYYADTSENISYTRSVGESASYSIDLDTLVHEVHYTIAAHIGLSIPIRIREKSIYTKRSRPTLGAIASYDFILDKNYPAKGLKDKRGTIHIAKDKDAENILLYLKFQIDPGPVANIKPKIVVQSIENAFEDLLKGMMNIEAWM